MMPQNHFVVAAIVTVLAVVLFYPDLDVTGAAVWVVAAGVAAAIIDVDVIVMVRWKARTDPELRPFTDMRVVSRDLRAMLRLLHRRGLLVKVAVPHVVSATVLTVAFYYLASSLFVPAFLGVWSHVVSDVPYVWSIMREA